MKIVIYHKGCSDGQAAAAVLYRQFPHAMFHPGVYGEQPPDCAGHEVYLVDFSYKRETVEQMLEVAESVTIIDHHKTAINDLWTLEHPKLTKFMTTKHSGAVLAWQYFHADEEVPMFLQYVEDRDLWHKVLPNNEEVMAYLYSKPFVLAEWEAYLDPVVWDTVLEEAILRCGQLVQSDKKRVQQLAEHSEYIVINGYAVPAVNAPHFHASDLGHVLAKSQPFAAVYHIVGNEVKYSLRTNNSDIDVGEIAATYGGGGHPAAAGFAVPIKEAIERGWL
jgi:oligoribonuclease NrnB/cAMP/cGMP phosphodiesterase (DHH superfamily)